MVLIAALLGTLAWSAPECAEAQVGYDGLVVAGGVVGGALIGVPSLIFTVADIVSFAQNTPFARGWAILEAVIASFMLATGIITIGLGAALDPQSAAGPILVGLIPLSLGALNLAHAIWSLVNLEDPAARVVRFTPFVAPHADGMIAGVGGAF